MRGDTDRPAITVAVVSWNVRELLDRCLRSLLEPTRRGLATVVVVDNGSTDGTVEHVRRHHRWARLVASRENLGFGAAVNRGLANAETEWVVAANADITVPTGALDRLLAVAQGAPSCGAAAPRLQLPDGSIQSSSFTFPRLSTGILAAVGAHRLSKGLDRRMFGGGEVSDSRPVDVEWAMGALLLLRRSAFEAAGKFDEGQWMYAEDLDLCWRLRKLGWRTIYVPTATIDHVGGAATSRAFGAASETVEVTTAQYDWLRRRRGGAIAATTAAAQMSGAAVRVVVYWLGARLLIPGARARREATARWLRILWAGWRRTGGDAALAAGSTTRARRR